MPPHIIVSVTDCVDIAANEIRVTLLNCTNYDPDNDRADCAGSPAELNPWTCVRLALQPMIRRIANWHDRVPVPGHQTELAKDLQ